MKNKKYNNCHTDKKTTLQSDKNIMEDKLIERAKLQSKT